jgi:hypothetical protein
VKTLTKAASFGKDEYGGDTSLSVSWPVAIHCSSCKQYYNIFTTNVTNYTT